MVTAVGLDLKDYDKDMSGAANFYRQLFGRWPDDEPEAEVVVKILAGCIEIMSDDSNVTTYFGIGCERETHGDSQLKNVEKGLDRIRSSKGFRELVALFYEEYSTELKILKAVIALWNKAECRRQVAEMKIESAQEESEKLRAELQRQQAYREGMNGRLEGVADCLCRNIQTEFRKLREEINREV